MKIKSFTNKSFIFAIAHAYDAVWRKFNAKLKRSGCNITEALVLIAIYFEEDKTASPSDLAVALRTSRGNISHCLTKLEQQRYIQRRLVGSDARRLSIGLSAAGTKLAQRLIAEIEEIETYCEDNLGSTPALLPALFALGQETGSR